MRLTAMVVVVSLLGVSPAAAQYPYDLDPYKPSDAALLRNYGAILAGSTPLLELHKLDPYVPSQATLLRQLGGAIPLWVGWYPPLSPAPASAPLTPFPRTPGASPAVPNVVVIIVSPSNRLPPPAPPGGRVAPLPQRPSPHAASPVQVVQNATSSTIEVRCDSQQCRWRVQRREPGSGTIASSACGWMPKGGAMEAGGPLPCEVER